MELQSTLCRVQEYVAYLSCLTSSMIVLFGLTNMLHYLMLVVCKNTYKYT